MKAVVLTQHGGPERLAAVEDVALPVPGPSEALIAVRACGVCFFDVLCRQGRRSRTKMPVILGHEIAGEIVAVGAAVTGFTVGDRVVCTGGIPCGECGRARPRTTMRPLGTSIRQPPVALTARQPSWESVSARAVT